MKRTDLELKVGMSKATEFALKATDSFALPDICVRVRSMLDDDSSSIDDVATLVSLDPSLAAKLLRLANSPLFRFRSEVDSLSKAVGIIGGEALYNLIMAETASSAFEHFTQQNFDTKRFWLQSIYAGLIAKHLAKLVRLRGSERFFLLGLLHNLGELVVSSKRPDLAEKCTHYSEFVSPWALQQQVLGFTYSDCSAEILRIWKLPTQLHFPLEGLFDAKRAHGNKERAIIHTSARAALALVSNGLYSVEGIVDISVLESVNLDLEILSDAVNFSNLESNKVLAVMSPKRIRVK